MDRLSWPTCILLGILLGLGAVAAQRTEADRTATVTADGAPQQPATSGDDTSSRSDAGSAGDASDVAPDTGRKDNYTVTLTFDDGPHPTYTPEVLDLLEQYDATAVFCMVGKEAAAHPQLVRKVVAAGHSLCNHSYTHDEQLADRTADRIKQEISKTAKALETAVDDADVRYFRQPGVHVQPQVEPIAESFDLAPLNWTIDPRDWSRPGTESIVQGVLSELRPGAIVLLHDGGGDRSQTVAALEQILSGIDLAGYSYVVPGERP